MTTIGGIQGGGNYYNYDYATPRDPSFGQAPVNYGQAPDTFNGKSKSSVQKKVKLAALVYTAIAIIATKGKLKGTKILSKEFGKELLQSLKPKNMYGYVKGQIIKLKEFIKTSGNKAQDAEANILGKSKYDYEAYMEGIGVS